MELEQLFSILNSSGVPFRYHSWPSGSWPKPPYGVYLRTRTNSMYADGKHYLTINHFQVELYTVAKDLETERKVEQALTAAEIPWAVTSETYLEDEGLFEVLYEIEV